MYLPRFVIVFFFSIGSIAISSGLKTTGGKGQFHGAKFSTEKSIEFGKALSDFKKEAISGEVILKAKIEKVCQKKGCWMTINANGESVRVRFKDYAFFVPKNISKQVVHIKGMFREKVLSASQQQHFLKDEGASEASIKKLNQAAKVTEFIASGVRI